MRYLCLIHLNEDTLAGMPSSEMSDLNAEHLDFNDRLRASGHFIVAEALEPASTTACVRVRQGETSFTDGPFTEAKEVVGGFAIFDVPSKAEMLKWTTRFMDLHKKHLPGWEGECEVRQIAGPGEKLCDQAREAQAAAI